MKIFRLFTIAAAALILSACSEDIAQMINGGKKEFTATLAAPNKGGTRTVYTEDTQNNKIAVAWKVGDEIALVHDKVMDVVKVKTVNADGSATIDGTITSATDEATVQLVYPAAAIELNNDKNPVPAAAYTEKMLAQDGTLSYIASNLDLRSGESTIAVDGDKATLASSVSLTSQIAIWKLSLLDGESNVLQATQVKIKGGTGVLASTATIAATSEVTLAIPNVAIDGALTIEATVGSDTYAYTKEEGVTFDSKYYQSKVMMEKPWDGNLATVTKNVTATDGTTIYGTLGKNVMISIADGATVTLDGVDINATGTWTTGNYAGITCLGDATIILKDGTENTVKGFYEEYPGIHPAVGKTLTIKGTGKLTASSNGNGAGIGGGFSINCGNIIIEGGTITATGGQYAAAIGSGGNGGSCGAITISGGTVTATGGLWAAGIGSGNNAGCGAITITSGVTSVTATKGASAPNSIGAGKYGTCGTVTIGGVVGAISTSPYTYPAPAATGHALSAAVVGDVVGSDGQAYDGTDYNNLPTGVTAVAKVCYVSGGHGLALALADESSAMDWSTAINTAAAHTPTVTGGIWKLATKDEWNNMFTGAGGAATLRTSFSGVGGSNLDSDYYWSSTESDSSNAWMFLFSNGSDGSWKNEFPKSMTIRVRACLAF